MVDVPPANKVTPPAPVRQRQPDRDRLPYGGATPPPQNIPGEAENGPVDAGDEASVLGIPESALTPEVVAAIRKMMDETARLRRELEETRRQEAHLGRLADRHSYLPLYNRRAFLREASKILVRAERTGAPCTLLYLHLHGLERIRAEHGRAAGDQAMVHAAWILRNRLRKSDLLGSMDGYDFIALLVLTGPEEAEATAREVVAAVEGEPFRWFDTPLLLRLSRGLHAYTPGETLEDVIDSAEQASRGPEIR